MVWKPLRCLYGLKQSPRMWNETISKFLEEIGFVRFKTDHGVYVSCEGEGKVFVALYVDDLLMVWKIRGGLEMVKRKEQKKYAGAELWHRGQQGSLHTLRAK